MKLYLKNILLSIFYYACFGIIYNAIIYAISSKTISMQMRFYVELISAIHYRIFKNLHSHFFKIILDYQDFLMILHGIFSNILLAIIAGSFYTFQTNKIHNYQLQKSLWNKTFGFTILMTMAIAISALLITYIWALNNRDASWYSNEMIFQRHLPTLWMFKNKDTYTQIGFLAGIIYFFKMKNKASL